MPTIRDVVAAVAGDDSALQNLRFDPTTLARSLSLGPGHLAALRSAERFFAAEKPILDRPGATPSPMHTERLLSPVIVSTPSAPELVATADPGALHTGPTEGTYTISSSAYFAAAVAPAPGPRPPSAPTTPTGPVIQPAPSPSPVTSRPSQPQPAPTPPVTPVAPVHPVPGQLPVPSRFPVPRQPSVTGQQPAADGLPPPGVLQTPREPRTGPPELGAPMPSPVTGCHPCCQAAVAAMVAEVGATANAALVALTAIARQRRRSDGRRVRGATS